MGGRSVRVNTEESTLPPAQRTSTGPRPRGFPARPGADAIRGAGMEPVTVDITNLDHIRALATRVHGDPQGGRR